MNKNALDSIEASVDFPVFAETAQTRPDMVYFLRPVRDKAAQASLCQPKDRQFVQKDLVGQMTRILFICWGNICRSPAAELAFTDLVRREGLEDEFFAASAGNRIYPPMRHLLYERGLDCSAKKARKIRRSDYRQL